MTLNWLNEKNESVWKRTVTSKTSALKDIWAEGAVCSQIISEKSFETFQDKSNISIVMWQLLNITLNYWLPFHVASLVAQTVKRETWVWSLNLEVPLEKGMGTHSSILAWRIAWTQKPGGLQPIGLQSQTWLSNTHFMCLWIFSPRRRGAIKRKRNQSTAYISYWQCYQI